MGEPTMTNDMLLPLPGGDKPLTATQARRLTDDIKTGIQNVWTQIQWAYHGQAWRALGYPSWDEYINAEFRDVPLRLPRGERQEVVKGLRDAGLSIRAIASATQSSPNTVQSDLAQVYQTDTPGTVTGLDGKTHPADYSHKVASRREWWAAESARKTRRVVDTSVIDLELLRNMGSALYALDNEVNEAVQLADDIDSATAKTYTANVTNVIRSLRKLRRLLEDRAGTSIDVGDNE